MKKTIFLGLIVLFLATFLCSSSFVFADSNSLCSVDADVVLLLDVSGSMDDGGAQSKCEWSEIKEYLGSNTWFLNKKYNVSEDWCTNTRDSFDESVANFQFVATTYSPAVNSKITNAKNAAKLFLGNLKLQDQSALVTFSDNAQLVKQLSTDSNATKLAIDSVITGGSTNIGDAIAKAILELGSANGNPQATKTIILLTDGKANRPNGTGVGEFPADVAYAQQKAQEAADLGYKIFTIGLGSDGEINTTMLQNIANITGATYHHSPDGSFLSDIYQAISFEMCQYGSISGCKYSDLNNNGVIDSTEPKLSGWEISLSGTATSTQATDEAGCYQFAGLLPGNYKVSEAENNGKKPFTQTFPLSVYDINLSSGANVVDYNFANYLSEQSSGIQPGDIVINEIMQNPLAVSDSFGEWFELYNKTQANIDLKDCTIKNGTSNPYTIYSSLVVPANGYVVLARNGDTTLNGGFTPNFVYSGFLLGNTADKIILTCNNIEIDRVEYDGGPNFPNPNGASMDLKSFLLDNNVGSNWCTSTSVFGAGDKGTPGTVNDICGAPTEFPAPVATPPAGTYSAGQSVALTASEATSIYYTTDGTSPTCSTGIVYVDVILVPSTLTISAIACYGENSSSVAVFPYVINTGGGGDTGTTYYTITASYGLNGSINPGSVTLASGSTQVFTIMPNSGYQISDVLVDGVSVGAVSTYTFSSIIANHIIFADFSVVSSGGGGGGGSAVVSLNIFNETTSNILEIAALTNWDSNLPATSRVVFDTISHPVMRASPNYGYTFSSPEDSTLVTSHAVLLVNLQPNTTYYWRAVSHDSGIDVFGKEMFFTTNAVKLPVVEFAGTGEGVGIEPEVQAAETINEESSTIIEQISSTSDEIAGTQTAAAGMFFDIDKIYNYIKEHFCYLGWLLLLIVLLILVIYYLYKRYLAYKEKQKNKI